MFSVFLVAEARHQQLIFHQPEDINAAIREFAARWERGEPYCPPIPQLLLDRNSSSNASSSGTPS